MEQRLEGSENVGQELEHHHESHCFLPCHGPVLAYHHDDPPVWAGNHHLVYVYHPHSGGLLNDEHHHIYCHNGHPVYNDHHHSRAWKDDVRDHLLKSGCSHHGLDTGLWGENRTSLSE